MKHTFAIGDSHGCLELLKKTVAEIETMVSSNSTHITSSQIVFLGDYIDRGPDSAGVVAFVRDRVDNHGDVALKGNHDEMMALAILKNIHVDNWIANGALHTIRSYGVDTSSSEQMEAVPRHPRIVEDAKWLNALPLVYQDDLRFFVHAGINPDFPLDEQSEADLLWIRSPFLNYREQFPKHVVHGHTAHCGDPASPHSNRTNLDTGAVHYGMMTAGVFNEAVAPPIGYIRTRLGA